MFIRPGRGILRTAAATAVVAGTATAVSNRVNRRQQQKWEQEDQAQQMQQMQAAQAAQQAVSGTSSDDTYAKLERLGSLKAQGLLTEEEFQAQKAKLLG